MGSAPRRQMPGRAKPRSVALGRRYRTLGYDEARRNGVVSRVTSTQHDRDLQALYWFCPQ